MDTLFTRQFKTILWKNWKIFKQKFSIFSICFELFVAFFIVATLSANKKSPTLYIDLPDGSEAYDTKESFEVTLDSLAVTSRYIAFVLPQNHNVSNIDGDSFIETVMSDSIFQKEFPITSKKFDTEQQLVYIVGNETLPYFLCAVIFGNDYTDYTISAYGKDVIDPNVDPLPEVDDYHLNNQYTKLFIQIQYAIDNAIIQWKTNHKVKGIRVSVGSLSEHKRTYPQTRDFDGLAPYLIFIIIGQIFHLSNHLMEEKENKIKEGLVVVGVNPSILTFSWTLIYFPLSFILITIIFIMSPIDIFNKINIFLYYLLLIGYIISMYSIVIIISNIIKKYKTVVVILCFFVSMMLSLPEVVFNLRYNGHILIHRILSAIFPFFGLSMAAAEIGNESIIRDVREIDSEYKITFSNMFDSEFGINFIFVLVDACFYLLLALLMEYIKGIEFRSFGVKRYLKKYHYNHCNEFIGDIQEDPIGSECYVEVKNLSKFYKYRGRMGTNEEDDKDRKKVRKIFAANNNISFKLYKNEIFGILGHNGAGKSTLIQNMMGIIKPDNGETYYKGQPFSKNKKEIYRQFGICLQSSIFIESFTVADHFKLYSGVKGVDDSEESLQQWLQEIDLVEKKDYLVEKLSGGQKRKLCIGLALIGKPKYVFLDEPTTGLDPLSRRKIWELLLKVKKDRVIFITTHYMDEADIIADRKLILSHGIIRCLGSSIYLKNHFNMKYNLEVRTQSPKAVDDIIHRIIPSAQLQQQNIIGMKNGGVTPPSQSDTTETNVFHQDNSSALSKTSLSSLVVHSYPNIETTLNIDDTGNKNELTSSLFEYSNKKFQHQSERKFYSDTISGNIYTWKLPIQSVELFSTLLKNMENARGRILGDFSLNAPMLEELFVRLEDEMERKRNENGNGNYSNNPSEVPQIPKVKRPGTLNTALRLCRYRLLVYIRQWSYLIMGILVPFFLTAFFLPVVKNQFNNMIFSNYGSREMSAKNFPNQQWNYEVENSDGSIANNVIAQELSGGNVQYLNHEEIIKNNREIYNAPYFVSSFSINYNESGIYDLNIYNNRHLTHSLPSTLNVLSNAILASNQINDTIHTTSKPLTYFKLTELNDPKLFATLIFILCISFPLSFYGMNVVRERARKLLKQFQLNGVSNKSYWLSVLISDHIMFMITCIVIGGEIVIFNFTPLLKINCLVVLFLFIYIGAFGCLLLQYCFSFYFKSDSNAFIVFFICNIVPTYSIFIEAYNNHIYADFGLDDVSFVSYLGVLTFLFCIIIPNFGIARSFRTMIHAGISHDALHTKIGFTSLLHPKNLILSCLVGEILSIFFYGFILKKIIQKVYNPKKGVLEIPEKINEQYIKEVVEGDEDIYNEYKRVGKNEQIPLRLIQLAKEYDDMELMPDQIKEALRKDKASKYGEFHMSDKGSRRIVMSAFDNVSIGVDKRECFGILGPNGSGKTSLLNTVSFSFPQTLGKIYYDGKDTTERRGNEISLGYCPQEDTLWDEYTLSEHIEMFLYVCGHSLKEAKKIAREFISYCHLTEHKNKMPSELSGGTRRKLNLLIALCCSSSKIIMDEPTAGMDPSTRRYVWDIIKSTLQVNDSSNMISTHSMEEAELLCNRIAIMIKGKIRCIGSPEHLKMKFGNSYILDVYTDNIEKFHKEVVIGCNLFNDSHYDREVKSVQRVKYEVQSKKNISRIFDIMEDCRKDGLFIDYNYSQTSLEQIFLNFANKYNEND
jgi:ABC-type multidrug transport system ATPase subunit